MRILIVEDEEKLAASIQRGFFNGRFGGFRRYPPNQQASNTSLFFWKEMSIAHLARQSEAFLM
jgi:hypothetical protein